MKKLVALFAAVLMIAMPLSGCSDVAGSSSNSPKVNSSSAPQSKVSASSTKPAALSAAGIKDALKKANVQNVTDVKLSSGTVTVVVNDENALSIDTYIQMNQPNSADAFKCVFGLNKSIKKVVYQSEIPVTDSYGKQSTVTGQTNTMERKDYEKVSDWTTVRAESPSQYYSIVNFELAPESQVSGIHAAWAKYFGQ